MAIFNHGIIIYSLKYKQIIVLIFKFFKVRFQVHKAIYIHYGLFRIQNHGPLSKRLIKNLRKLNKYMCIVQRYLSLSIYSRLPKEIPSVRAANSRISDRSTLLRILHVDTRNEITRWNPALYPFNVTAANRSCSSLFGSCRKRLTFKYFNENLHCALSRYRERRKRRPVSVFYLPSSLSFSISLAHCIRSFLARGQTIIPDKRREKERRFVLHYDETETSCDIKRSLFNSCSGNVEKKKRNEKICSPLSRWTRCHVAQFRSISFVKKEEEEKY